MSLARVLLTTSFLFTLTLATITYAPEANGAPAKSVSPKRKAGPAQPSATSGAKEGDDTSVEPKASATPLEPKASATPLEPKASAPALEPTPPITINTPTLSPAEARPFGLGYAVSPLGIIIPFKHGPYLSWRTSKKWAFEAAYFAGSISLDTPIISVGSVKESFLSLNSRRFVGDSSFNWVLGIAQQSYTATLGESLLFTGGIPTSFNLLTVRTVGAQLGLGNRWVRSNGLTFGCDWLVINVPFMTIENSAPALNYVSDATTRTRIEDAVKILRYLPTFAIAKVHIGYSF